uniref:PEHE domain-containing protein n=1 Tax=Romanomermis culicivorax TaxID=13658 RepID=A0A915JAH9_ROMCU
MTNKQHLCLRRLVNFFKALGVLSDANLEALEENLTKEAQIDDDSTNICETENFRVERRPSFCSQSLYRLGDDANSIRSRRNIAAEADFAALKLQKLKELILDQAKELKKQKLSLDEKDRELHRLFAENEELRNEILHLTEKLALDVSRIRYLALQASIHGKIELPCSVSQDIGRKGRKCLSENIKDTFEITRLGPTSSKIRRVRINSTSRRSKPKSDGRTHADTEDSSGVPIITPSWRFIHFNPTVVLEGTEDITDDMFTKRHNRLQTEEKRLIRRDRMRERYLEFYRKKSPNEPVDNKKEDGAETYVEAIFISGKVQKLPPVPANKNIPCLRSNSKSSKSLRSRRN